MTGYKTGTCPICAGQLFGFGSAPLVCNSCTISFEQGKTMFAFFPDTFHPETYPQLVRGIRTNGGTRRW